jgi:hypothetical protein
VPWPPTAALAARHARIRESLDTLSLDALISRAAHQHPVSLEPRRHGGILVLTRDGVHLLVDFR